MSELLRRINDEIKTCMKAGDKERLGVVRMLLNEVKTAQVNVPGGREREWSDAEILEIVSKYHKNLQKTLEEYPAERRAPLEKEIRIVEEFLPRQLSDDELIAVIRREVSATSERNFGALMKQMQVKLSGQANGKAISAALKTVLQSLG